MEKYFIHIADPTFFEAPWPGERRLGPFTDDPITKTKGLDAAKAQAVSDLANGQMSEENFIGIFDEENSDMRHDGTQRGKMALTPSRIKPLADTKRKKIHAESMAMAQEQVEMLQAMLPPGVSIEDVNALARAQRAMRIKRAQEDADVGA